MTSENTRGLRGPRGIIAGAVTALALTGLTAPALMAQTLTVDGEATALSVTSCSSGTGYYLIDAEGEGVRVSVVGNDSYSSVDVLLLQGGPERRAVASGPFLPLEGKGFAYSGTVEASDGSTLDLSLEMEGC